MYSESRETSSGDQAGKKKACKLRIHAPEKHVGIIAVEKEGGQESRELLSPKVK
jgi:hypothetical protein